MNHNRFLGYTKDDNGQLIIVPEEAKAVKRIYREYLNGASLLEIANGLEADGILTGAGRTHWRPESVRIILTNEKYMGDALLQKTYTVDFLSKKRIKNNGDVPQYYVENSHEAIIPKDIYMMVQNELRRRAELHKSHRGYSSKYALTGIVKCECCGADFRRVKWNNRGCKSTVWRCVSRVNKKDSGLECSARTVLEEDLKKAVIQAINDSFSNKDEMLAKFEKSLIAGIGSNNTKIEAINNELSSLQKLIVKMTEKHPEYDKTANRILELRSRRQELLDEEAGRQIDRKRIESLMETVKTLPTELTEYDEYVVRKLVEQVVVTDEGFDITLKNGTSKSIR